MLLDFEYLRNSNAITPEEGELLYALVRATKPNVVVETGTHKMLSTHYLAQAVKDNGFGHVTTCDPIDWEQVAIHTVSSLHDYITYKKVRGADLDVKDIDFLFIDGFHALRDVNEELEHFLPLLTKNALVVFHDCDDNEGNNIAGVNAAITEKGLKTVYIKSKNRMRIYEHSGI